MKKATASLPALLLIAISLPAWICAQTTCFITVNQAQVINPCSRKLLGTSFDGRTSAYYLSGPNSYPLGYYDPDSGDILPAVEPLWDRTPMNGVRYPGNLAINNWNWSYTLGSPADRPPQSIGPGLPVQSLVFGFDEFMDMVAEKELSTEEVQIMVNITASTGQPNPAILAADWVEYCNAPNDGLNPRGGVNWAAVRDSLGHPDPYGVKIWNIGNEPWGPIECCQGNPALYISIAEPIIDSMLNVDSTLHLILPSVGNGSSAWNQALIDSPELAGKFYGLSPHYFYDEDPNTPNPSVSQVKTALTNLADTALAHGLKVIVGDHAHYAPASDPDKAMRWQGALATADFLLTASQTGNIELGNFWIYGNPKANWHPIRSNTGGTYTFMAAAQMYERLDSVFYDQSLQTTVADSAGGNVPAVRASAFKSNNGMKASVAVVNIDSAVNRKAALPGMPGFTLMSARLTSAELSDDTSSTVVVAPLPDGTYSLPHSSILFFDYSSFTLPVELLDFQAHRKENAILLSWQTAAESGSAGFDIQRSYNALDWKSIGYVTGAGNSSAVLPYEFLDEQPLAGINYYRLRQTDFNGQSNFSPVRSAEWTKDFDFGLFPNPAGDKLFLKWPPGFESEEAVISIYAVDGRLWKTASVARKGIAEISIASLEPGIYLAALHSEQVFPVRFFVKK